MNRKKKVISLSTKKKVKHLQKFRENGLPLLSAVRAYSVLERTFELMKGFLQRPQVSFFRRFG
jgi:hypothetical protein